MQRLTLLMADRGMTADDLFFETRIPVRTIARWRAGGGGPSMGHLKTLCQKLNVSADWLIGAVNAPTPIPLSAEWDGQTERRATGSPEGPDDPDRLDADLLRPAAAPKRRRRGNA